MRAYLDLLEHVLANGEQHFDRTGVGTRSVFGYQIRFNLQAGFPLVTTKKMFFRGVVEELLWILSGSTDEHMLRDKDVHIWRQWATEEQCAKFGRIAGDLGPVYGHLWRHFGGTYITKDERETFSGIAQSQRGVDQIAKLLDDMNEKPNSRRLIVSAWDAAQCDEVELPPCHTLFQFKIHTDNSLSCHLYARSIDAFLGLPFNIASYALLTEMIAHVTLRKARSLVISFGDLHIYNTHVDAVSTQLTREPFMPPSLLIDTPVCGPASALDKLLSIKYEDIKLLHYNSHSKLTAEVAV